MNKDERKKLLDKLLMLPCAQEATLDSNSQRFSPKCHAETRVEFLVQIKEWFQADTHNQVIFWLNGMAGTGKSTIARTIAEHFQNAHQFGASFFFKRGEQDRSHAKILFTTIASQLAQNIPDLGPLIARTIESNPKVLLTSIDEQFKHLILRPLSELKPSPIGNSKYSIVIDALDECDNEAEIDLVIHLLSQLGPLRSTKIFLTSRPELPIRAGFGSIEGSYEHFVLTDIEQHIIKQDILIFLKDELKAIKLKHERCFPHQKSVLASWPSEESVKKLADMATPLFIVATTICRMLRDTRIPPEVTLDDIFERREALTEEPESEINVIYMRILEQLLIGLPDTEENPRLDTKKSRIINTFQGIVGPIINLATPLSADSLAHLLNIEVDDVAYGLASLNSVLSVPLDTTKPIRLLHLSFRDFLTSPYLQNRKGGGNLFWINEIQNHKDIATACLRRLSDPKTLHHLEQNICKLTSPGKLRTGISKEAIEENLPPDVRYACCYWVYHLKQAETRISDGDQVHHFLRAHFLHWVEALCLLGKSYDIIVHIRDLGSLVASGGTEVNAFIKDAQRFVLANRSIGDMAPLQLYSSALIFSPHNSIIRKTFESEIPGWIQILPKVDDEWDAVLQELDYWRHHDTDPSQYIDADGLFVWGGKSKLRDSDFMKFSPAEGSNVIALSGNDSMVRLYDSFTGAPIQTLRGHDGPVTAIDFSSDGRLLVSGSRDKTVKVWDAVTGALKLTLEGHEDHVKAVLFSADGSAIFSIASDELRQWDPETGERRGVPLRRYFLANKDISFSPDGQLLLSVPNQDEAWLWKFTSPALQRLISTELNSYENALMGLSLDGEMVVVVVPWHESPGTCQKMEISSTTTGKLLHTVTSEWGRVQAMIVLQDGKLAALTMGMGEGEEEGEEEEEEEEEDYWSHICKFNYVIFGDPGSPIEPKVTLINLRTRIGSIPVAISPDGKLLIFALTGRCPDSSLKLGVCVYDSATGMEIHRLKQVFVAGDQEVIASQALSPDNKVMASISESGFVMLHNLETGQLLHSLGSMKDDTGGGYPLQFETDQNRDPWGGYLTLQDRNKYGRSHILGTVRFSRDGTRVVAISSGVNFVKGWDSNTGQLVEIIEGPWSGIQSFDFLPDGNLAVLGYDNAIRVRESATGELRQQFVTTSVGEADTAAISPNNKFVAARGFGWLCVWDLSSGEEKWESKGYALALTFFPNSKEIAVLLNLDFLNSLFEIGIYDCATGGKLRTVARSQMVSMPTGLTFSPDGNLMATSGPVKCGLVGETGGDHFSHHQNGRIALLDPKAELMDIDLGMPMSPRARFMSIFNNRFFIFPRDKLALWGAGSHASAASVSLWDISTGACVLSFDSKTKSTGFYGFPMAVSAREHSLIVALKCCSESDFVEVWDAKTATALELLKLPSLRGGDISEKHSLNFSPDGSLLAALAKGSILVWDVVDMTPANSNPFLGPERAGRPNSNAGLKLSPRFKINTGPETSPPEFSPDGKVIAFVSGDQHTYKRTVEVWNTEERGLLRGWTIYSALEIQLRFSPDGKQLLSYSGYQIQIWLISSGELLREFKDVLGSAYSMSLPGTYYYTEFPIRIAALSRQNTLLALNVSYEAHFRIIIKDVETGETVQTIMRTGELSMLSFSEGDSHLKTNRGTFDINRCKNYESFGMHDTLRPRLHSIAIDEHQEWICLDGDKILWLPHKYRPADSNLDNITIQEIIVAIKTENRRLIFIEFKP
ncbi:hypothetical protein TWF730_002482 [Orbilia blumenaviensis]|uniref:Nephrocystin 3-like N-terminal domain-containing protein n=1 Tax=Orbilia blumenaviensis TaxID=1796055 RepID=A0AAV9UA15_9PEZI